MAKWFADLFDRFGFTQGIHVRKIHYILVVSKDTALQHDGEPYENTEECWNYLVFASKQARYLGLVDTRSFVDHRNPPVHMFSACPVDRDEPSWRVDDFLGWSLPRINPDLEVNFDLPDAAVDADAYEYDDGDQPYHLEIWIEKNTMNDVLLPICKEYKVNLSPALGFQSITNAVQLLGRVENNLKADRPVRIFYISDFDPAGVFMATAVARQLQFWMEMYGLRGDLKLTPLCLTKQQIEQYSLPRKPIKKPDLRKGAFEDRHGEGAVELDALEAIHPGELEGIVTEVVLKYRDLHLEEQMEDAYRTADYEMTQVWAGAIEDAESKAEELRSEAQAIADKYKQPLTELKEEYEKEMEPIRARMETVEIEVQEDVELAADDMSVDLPDCPVADITPPDEDDWLFDSNRSYFEQIEVFKNHKEGE